jgi:FAD synthetase
MTLGKCFHDQQHLVVRLHIDSYTSLGSTYNTFPNPALLIKETASFNGPNGVSTPVEKYRPAYELLDNDLERDGRAK